MSCVRRPARGAGVLAAVLLVASSAPAQVKYPPMPDTADVQIRYRIRGDRDERVRQFRDLEANLAKAGFVRKRQPEDDLDILDPTAERFDGTVPYRNALALLADPRVLTVVYRPADFKTPDDPAAPVSVRARVAAGYVPAEQQRLHRQVVAQLGRLGFREAAGYAHAGYTLVRGDLPAGNLFRLLKDLRGEPAGWFAADTPAAELPPPLRDTNPIRAVEVLAGADLTFLNPPPVAPGREKLTPDLRAVLDDAAARERPARVEVLTDRRFESADVESIRTRLRGSYARAVLNPQTRRQDLALATLEGVVGNLLTIDFPRAADVEGFANEAGVVVVRLPRAAVETTAPTTAAPTPPADALAATKVGDFHRLGQRGQGVKVVVVASDFPGLGSWLGVRFLPGDPAAPVAVIDLTAESARDLRPAPPRPGGSGTAAARAARLAAPDAAVVLVRVDPSAYHQVFTFARYARGEMGYSEAMQSRVTELTLRSEELRGQNAAAVAEYQAAFANLSDDDRPHERREVAARALQGIYREQADLAGAIGRFNLLLESVRALAGTTVVVNTLVWESGHPLDGLSDLSRLIDTTYASDAVPAVRTRSATRPRDPARPLWVQAGSPSLGSVWGGAYRDADGNGAAEFVPPDAPLRAGEWTRELNFLAARTPDGMVNPTLTAGARVRLTVQWRETHDPTAYGGAESIFPLAVRVFKQLDPEGKTRASDELREVARPVGGPYRILGGPTFGVYEQVVEFAVPEDGRYCVMMEGRVVYDPRLPALARLTEVQPRLFAEFVGTGPAAVARLVFASAVTRNAGVGIPGDAKAAITVGTTDAPTSTAPAGMTGGGTGVQLLTKPDLLADGTVGVAAGQGGGPAVAAGFAGGALAGLMSSGAPATNILRATGLSPGGPVAIPEGWLRAVGVRAAQLGTR